MNNIVDITENLISGSLDKKLFQFIEYFPTAAFFSNANSMAFLASK